MATMPCDATEATLMQTPDALYRHKQFPEMALVRDELVGAAEGQHAREEDGRVDDEWDLGADRPQRETHARVAVDHRRDVEVVLLQLAREVEVDRVHEVVRVVRATLDALLGPNPASCVSHRVVPCHGRNHPLPGEGALRVRGPEGADYHSSPIIRAELVDLFGHHAVQLCVRENSRSHPRRAGSSKMAIDGAS